jgi:hypothetical protein
VSTAKANEKLVEVKLALVRKYERLAKVAKSTPKRRTWLYHAARIRRQAADLARQ